MRLRRGLLIVFAAICASVLLVAAQTGDYYQCFQDGHCSPALSSPDECEEGRDYDVTAINTGSAVTVVSFHGGLIERHTSEIALALAQRFGWNRYDFNAHGTAQCLTGTRTTDFAKLHITATNFDDPRAVTLVAASPKAVAIHGHGRTYLKGSICVGGKDAAARNAFIAYVKNNAAAWPAYQLNAIDSTIASSGDCSADDLAGTASANLVNRTSTGGGLQLELHSDFRADLVNSSTSFDTLRNLFYEAIHQAMATCSTATAGASWTNKSFTSQSSAFTAEWDATPSVANIDAVVGLSNGAQTSFAGFACLTRFNTSGTIDARDGSVYRASSSIPYAANTTYHFRLSVNVPAHTYSIFVTPRGGSEQTLGVNYAFRTEQSAVGSLNNYGVIVDSAAGAASVCNFTMSGSNTLFQDSFAGTDGLITNEYAHWNSDGVNSPDWDMTSGSLFRQSNTAWTGVPDSLDPNKFSSDHTDSDVFRLNTFRTFAGNTRVSLAVKNNSEIHDLNCNAGNTCWHGVHVWLRYLTQYDLYIVSLNRADNKVVIKRKVPCGSDNNGYYRELAEVTHAWSVGTWQHFSTTIQTNNDGTVTIKVYDDDSNPNTPLLIATDAGNTNPEWTSACTTPGSYPTSHYPPLTAAGSVGVRGDFDNFNFDDFRVSSF